MKRTDAGSITLEFKGRFTFWTSPRIFALHPPGLMSENVYHMHLNQLGSHLRRGSGHQWLLKQDSLKCLPVRPKGTLKLSGQGVAEGHLHVRVELSRPQWGHWGLNISVNFSFSSLSSFGRSELNTCLPCYIHRWYADQPQSCSKGASKA